MAALRRHLPRRLSILLLMLVPAGVANAATLAPAVQHPGSPTPPTAGFRRNVHFLFEIDARSGAAIRRRGGKLTVRLRGAPDYVTRFTDRPDRQAAALLPRDLVSLWRRMFSSSSPNAVLSYAARPGARARSIVVTLGRPRFDARRDLWSFPATRIFRTDPALMGAHRARLPRVATPRRFGTASLFIDDSWETDDEPPTTCSYTDSTGVSWHIVIGRDGWAETDTCEGAIYALEFSVQNPGRLPPNWHDQDCYPDTNFPLNIWRLYWDTAYGATGEQALFFAWPLSGAEAVNPATPVVQVEYMSGAFAPCGYTDFPTGDGGIAGPAT